MSTTINNKIEECEVCGADSAKYTCPKCEVRTCTLKCVNIHKKELECDGIRDRTKFIPLSKFTNLDLLSDYRLLEEVTRSVETLKKDQVKKYTRINTHLPRHLYLLKRNLSDRHTTLEFLPGNFLRHKQNTTHINFKSKQIYWRIEWNFYNADQFKIADDNCHENCKFSSLIQKYLDPKLCRIDQLKFYQSTGFNGLEFYLKAEHQPAHKYYALDPSGTIRENMANKTIIEFPQIHVVLKGHSNDFQVIHSDNEDEEMIEIDDPKSYVTAIVNAEEKSALKTSKKRGNLLFVSEYSSDELSTDTET